MNKFERKFIVNPKGKTEEKKLTEEEKIKLNPAPKPHNKNVLTMTDRGSFIVKDPNGKTVEVIKEGEKLEL